MTTSHRAWRFAKAASVLAEEAARLTLTNQGAGHEAAVAQRAADHAHEAVLTLEAMAKTDATLDAVLEAATWAMAAAAIALTQAKLPPGTTRLKVLPGARGEGGVPATESAEIGARNP